MEGACYTFIAMIRYEDRQSQSCDGKELLRNEKDLTEANLGSSLLGREESNKFGEPELGGLAVGWAARVPLKISRSTCYSA